MFMSTIPSSPMQRPMQTVSINVKKRNGQLAPFDPEKVRASLLRACSGVEREISIDTLYQEIVRNIYNNVTTQEIEKALVLAASSFIEQDTAYDKVATRLLLQKAYREVFGLTVAPETCVYHYKNTLKKGIAVGIEHDVLTPRLREFDIDYLAGHLITERDELLSYLGMHTLYERYLLKIDKQQRYELPQTFWMRIAMGLALDEKDKEQKAIEFYHILSSLRYMPSTPTLFHAGHVTPQLSSCYLSTVDDDLAHIFKVIGDNAQLAKWAGGIGNDWTNIRGTGSIIKSIHATSQGVIPYLRIVNDVVVCITRSGIRRGGTCVYLENWHCDYEDFIDLRRNTGDERRRAHDMNTASWIPDLFMKRVEADADWSFFSPHEAPDLHDLYGKAFQERYEYYEQEGRKGNLSHYRTMPAKKLWRKMLSRLFETGHPWITFKDPCNVRSPQDHVGVIHSSNLCTEITLNTSADETAVCNLGSINLAQHVVDGRLDKERLAESIHRAIHMLDNVIDLNFYPTPEAENSNKWHRPIGLGMMGFQDALFMLDISFNSPEALEFADMVGEFYSYHAILASSALAKERGTYQTYKGSKWSRGIFPLDTLDLLEQERGSAIKTSRKSRLDWKPVRDHVAQWGMRNSNVMAIAPTATIANIAGCFPSIEPMYKNLYVKSNIAGEFTIVNKYLVHDLKELNLWNKDMLDQIKFYDGEIDRIETIPANLKEKYKGAFEIDPIWQIQITAARGKWIDQSQSHNVFMKGASGKKLEEIYMSVWHHGLKTSYYLRTLGATQIEKSTLDANKYGYTQKRAYEAIPGSNNSLSKQEDPEVNGSSSQKESSTSNDEMFPSKRACDFGINIAECESCQ